MRADRRYRHEFAVTSLSQERLAGSKIPAAPLVERRQNVRKPNLVFACKAQGRPFPPRSSPDFGQDLQEQLPERTHGSIAGRRPNQVNLFSRVSRQVVEHLGPHAIPNVMMARGHQRQLEPAIPAVALVLPWKAVQSARSERAGVVICWGTCAGAAHQ